MAPNSGHRMGGRSARKAQRAAALPDNMKPVHPGQESGNFKPLKEDDLPKIHEAVLEVLETIGMDKAIPSCIEACTAVGCTVSAEGRLLFPRSVVKDGIAKTGRDITFFGASPEHDLHLSGKKVHFGTAGAAVHILDPISRKYRESNLADLFDIARICDTLEHIHFFQRSIVCRDLEDVREMDLNTCYASIAGTKKHVGTSFSFPENVDEALQMLHLIAGSEEAWRERPFVSMSVCHVVPPLKFAEDASACLEAGVKGGMPILLLSAGQAGATSPASLARCVVQATSEVLAGLVYVNAIQEGAPAIFGAWPFVSDLRTGAMSGGSGEQAVLMAACGQMAKYYDLPCGIAAGMTDSKIPDAQSGYEKGYTVSLAGHSGANLIYESAGMHASLLGCCLESYVIDNDMLGAINRTIRGIEVNAETLGLGPIRDVCLDGPGHYLGHEQTLSRMETDYLYPIVGDRENINNWIEQGSTDVIQRAHLKVKEILKNHFPKNWSEEIDQKIREQFPVRLPRTRMKATEIS
jgi:trimethylamine--corrinoid protein Co-methyltransferase